MAKLPTRLDREPLVEAVFEVRFDAHAPIADIMPGLLYQELSPRPILERLPAADIPPQFRDSDPAWTYTPTIRLNWERHYILFSNRSIALACKLPYPGWSTFKEDIVDLIRKVSKFSIVDTVDRYSLKYINILPGLTAAEQISLLNMSVVVGGVSPSDGHISLQVHQIDGDLNSILSIVTNAQGQTSSGKTVSGVVVDIDTIQGVNHIPFGAFAESIDTEIDRLRRVNKEKFFSCITEGALREMGPHYG